MKTRGSDCDNVEEMRTRLSNVFHRQLSTRRMSNSAKRRKLILHFDVNKTIVAVDSATGETVEDSLNVYLSGMAWGKENAGKWECAVDELSLQPSETGNVSFYKYEERKFHKIKDRSAFRCQLSSFTDKPQGSNFKPYLLALLNKLAWRIPYDEKIHGHMTVPGTKDFRYHFILPAFFKLLNHLVKENRDFAIVLRSFGSDANSVLKCIKDAMKHKMPFGTDIECLSGDIAHETLVLRRNTEDNFILKSESSNGTNVLSTDAKTDDEMYNLMTSCTGITAIVDDVNLWATNNFHPSKGKPLWVDQSDEDTQHIFFDDNIRPGSSDSIVNLRVKRSSTGTYEHISPNEESAFVNKNIVPVAFPDAILNDDYFIEKVKLCETKYDTC